MLFELGLQNLLKAKTPLENLDMDLIKTPQSAIMSVELRECGGDCGEVQKNQKKLC